MGLFMWLITTIFFGCFPLRSLLVHDPGKFKFISLFNSKIWELQLLILLLGLRQAVLARSLLYFKPLPLALAFGIYYYWLNWILLRRSRSIIAKGKLLFWRHNWACFSLIAYYCYYNEKLCVLRALLLCMTRSLSSIIPAIYLLKSIRLSPLEFFYPSIFGLFWV